MFAFSMKILQSRKNRKTLEINMGIRTGLNASVSPLARARKIMAPIGVVPSKPLICPASRRYMQMWNFAETICEYAEINTLRPINHVPLRCLEITLTYFERQSMAIYEVCDYFCVIIDWSSIG